MQNRLNLYFNSLGILFRSSRYQAMNAIILVKRLGHKLTINEEDRPMTTIRNVCLITISFIGLAFTSLPASASSNEAKYHFTRCDTINPFPPHTFVPCKNVDINEKTYCLLTDGASFDVIKSENTIRCSNQRGVFAVDKQHGTTLCVVNQRQLSVQCLYQKK
ncbi:MAG: hypothetical protein PWK00_02075 [Coxiella burnetii]|nr:hypothetical protein [Coxiella burnetii]